MKKLIYVLGALFIFSLSSCEKCADCSCQGDISFEFSSEISSTDQKSLEDSWTSAYTNDYPDEAIEICAKRKDLDTEMADYEAKTETYTDEPTVGGNAYKVTYVYTCDCTE